MLIGSSIDIIFTTRKLNTMTFNPLFHNRQSIRLNFYDYSKVGIYFFTICIEDRRCLLGEISNEEMFLSELGEIALKEWHNLTFRFKNIELGEFTIMPNHIHGIIIVKKIAQNDEKNLISQTDVGATLAVALPTLGNIIGAFKSLVTTSYLKILKDRNPDIILGKLWQGNYFERIIKDEEGLRNASLYLKNNSKNWDRDELS